MQKIYKNIILETQLDLIFKTVHLIETFVSVVLTNYDDIPNNECRELCLKTTLTLAQIIFSHKEREVS